MCRLKHGKSLPETKKGDEFYRPALDAYEEKTSPQNPQTLMPLILPFLNYEETCVMKQLNSSFNDYITERKESRSTPKPNKARRIVIRPTLEMDLHIEISISDRNPNEIYECTLPLELKDTAMVLDIHEHRRPFLEVFLQNQGVPHEISGSRLTYKIENRAKGLELLLRGVAEHFAIGELYLGDKDVIYDAEYEMLRVTLAELYQPNWGKPSFCYFSRDFRPICAEFIKFVYVHSVAPTHIKVLNLVDIDLSRTPIHLIQLEANILVDLIKDWKSSNRRICAVKINGAHAYREKFDSLCTLLEVDNRQMKKEINDEYHWTDIIRRDKKKLRAQLYITDNTACNVGYPNHVKIFEIDSE